MTAACYGVLGMLAYILLMDVKLNQPITLFVGTICSVPEALNYFL
jgi:hypothetical protein